MADTDQQPTTVGSESDLVQSIAPFSTVVQGVNVIVVPGQVYRRTDPVVRSSPDSFRVINVLDSSVHSRPLNRRRSPGEETATAGPGERRTLTRPDERPPGPPAKAAASGGRGAAAKSSKEPAAAAAGTSEV